MSDLTSKLESILFISGDPIRIQRLCFLLVPAREEDIRQVIEALGKMYESRGIRIVLKDEKVQMVSAPEHAGLVDELVKSYLSEELTPAALETLACVAYREPVTKADIDDLRGVNSVISLRALMMRGLVEKGRGDTYRTSIDFLKKLGIEKVTDLPYYEELQKNPPREGGAA